MAQASLQTFLKLCISMHLLQPPGLHQACSPFVAGKKAGQHKFLWGIAVSIMYFAIIVLAGIWIMGNKPDYNTLTKNKRRNGIKL